MERQENKMLTLNGKRIIRRLAAVMAVIVAFTSIDFNVVMASDIILDGPAVTAEDDLLAGDVITDADGSDEGGQEGEQEQIPVTDQDGSDEALDDISSGSDKGSAPDSQDNLTGGESGKVKPSAGSDDFKQSAIVDGVIITVTADKGVLPDNAVLKASLITDEDRMERINGAVDSVREEGLNVGKSYTFDIHIEDEKGNEIEPDTAAGKVYVAFAPEQTDNVNLTPNIYHIIDETSPMYEDAVKEAASGDGSASLTDGMVIKSLETDKAAVPVAADMEKGDKAPAGGKDDEATGKDIEDNADEVNAVVAETDGFSYYTVEFTYGELTYVLEGGCEARLSDVLEAIGITGNIESAKGSDDSLFKTREVTYQINDESDEVQEANDESLLSGKGDKTWVVRAEKAFTTEEELTVTVDGIDYIVKVTDDSSLPGARHFKDSSGNVFLGGNYIEVGLDKTGSYGTSAAAPSNMRFHATSSYGNKLGLRSDGDGFDQGNNPNTGDFFLPGSPEECYILGYAINGSKVDNRNAARNSSYWSGAKQAPTTEDKSEGNTLKAVTTGITKDNVKLEITTSFNVNDKFFKTQVKVTNLNNATIQDVRYARSFDPDQDVEYKKTYVTYNKVISNPNSSTPMNSDTSAMVVARGQKSFDGFFFIAFDERARASRGVAFSLYSVFKDGLWTDSTSMPTKAENSAMACSESNTNGYTREDNAIALTFKLGTLKKNESASFEYYSSLDPNVESSFKEVKKDHFDYDADGDGAAEEDTRKERIDNEAIYAPAKPYKRSFLFLEWNTKADGTGTSYQPGQRVREDGSVTLYAIYEPVKSTAYIDLTLDGSPWNGQKLELYQDKTKKYDLKAGGTNGRYYNTAVVNGTYDVFMNGRDANAAITFDADQDPLVKTVKVSYATLTVNTYLDDAISSAPGDVTLRTGSKVIYTPSALGGVSTQTVLTSEPAYNIYVDGEDTGFTASPSDKTKNVYFYRMTVNIKDDKAWTDAGVELTDTNGNLKAVLAPGTASGTTVPYTKILQKDEAVLKLIVNGIDTHRTMTAKTGSSVTNLTYYTSTVTLKGTGLSGFNVSIDNGTENYSYKTTNTASPLKYTAEHVYLNNVSGTERPYGLDIEGVYTGDANYRISSSNKNLTIDLVLVNFFRCQISGTGDNRTLSYLSDPVYHVYVVKGKNMTAYRGNYGLNGYTFACWSKTKWTLDAAPSTAFNFTSPINADTSLYTNYAKPTLLINDIVRTDASGAQSGTGLYYTMSNLTITGFDKGNSAIKYIFLKPEKAKSVKITNNSNKTITFGGTGSTSGTITTITPLSTGESIGITFNSAVSMTAAQEFLRKNVIIELTSGTAHNITVEAMDGNGEFVAANSVSGSASDTTVKFIDGTQNLNGGTYYVLSNATYNGNSSHRDGLTVAHNTTSYLYIAPGVTLNANGYSGWNQTGAGPGIYVPSDSTLVIYGGGTLNAKGGKAGDGTGGTKGGDGYLSTGSKYYGGSGSSGGAGGGGAAAGIGGAGGNGGGGGGSTGYGSEYTSGTSNYSGSNGNDGARGEDGYNMGTVYIQGSVTVNVWGGSAGSKGNGGSAGSNKYSSSSWSDRQYHTAGAGGGGGGGGAGYQAPAIGSGAPGAGGGGSGGQGGIDYSKSDYGSPDTNATCNGEGGGGGRGAVNGSGGGGTRDSGKYNGDKWDKEGGTGGSGGAAGNYGSSGLLYKASTATLNYKEGSNNGKATSSGGTTKTLSPATYSITYNKPPTKYIKGTVTIKNGTTTYKPAESYTITMPSYEESDSSINFLGWQLNKYAKGKDDNINCGKADSDAKKRFQAGQKITLDPTTYGDIQFTAVTEIMGGIRDDDTKKSITLNASSSTTYYKYTVKVTVDGVQTDRGAISIGGLTVTADTSKNYIVTTTSGGSKSIVIDGAQVGSVAANGTTTIAYKTIKVNVAGKLPSSIKLTGSGAPLLVDEGNKTSPYTYSYETLASNASGGPFGIYIDGEDTGITVGYGTPATVQYYTLTVNVNTAGVAGSAVKSVELRNDDETIFLDKKSTDSNKAVFTTTQLKSNTEYRIYVNGEETDKTAKFASDSTVEVSYARYTTYVNTMLDGVPFDFGTVMFGENRMVRKEKGKYQVTLRTTGSYDLYVDGIKVRTGVSVGSTQTVDYYTVNYEYSGDEITKETGELPEDENYYLKGSSATLLEKGAVQNGGKTFTGWKIGDSTKTSGEEITVNSTVTARAQWRRTAFTEADQKFELSLDETMFNYNGKSQIPGITVTRNGVKLSVDRDYTVSFTNTNTCMDRGANNTINAGTVGVTVTGIGDYSETLYDSYMIMKKTVSVEGLGAVDRVYNGSLEVDLTIGDVVITGIEPVDTGKVTVTTGAKGRMETAVVGTNKDVNVNATTVSGEAAPNYVLEAADPIRVNIFVKPITAEMFSAAAVYYNGAAQEPELVATDIQPVDGVNINLFDEVTFKKVADEAESKEAAYSKSNTYWYSENVNAGKGKITIKAVYDDSDQYSNYEGEAEIEFDINKRPLILTAKPATSVYGQPVTDVSRYYKVTTSISENEILHGEAAPAFDAADITPSQIAPVCTAADWAALKIHAVTTVGEGYDAGTYADAVKVMYTPNANYEVTGNAAVYVVGKASADLVKVTAYDYTGVYDGNAHGIVVKTEGISASDEFTVYYNEGTELTASNYNTAGTATRPVYTNAGEHTVYYWVDSNNYEGKGGSATVNITPAPLTVKPAVTVTYGDEGVNNTNETITYSGGSTSITMKPASGFLSYAGLTASGFVGSDTASSALSGEVKAAASYAQYGAGEYTLTVDTGNTTLAANNNNYAITYLPGVFTVNKKQVSFVWEPAEASFTYTGTEHGVFASVDPDDIEGSDDVRVGEYVIGESSTDDKWITNHAAVSGNYIARVKALAGNKAKNYSFVPDESAITTDENGVTGDLTPNASNSAIKWTIQEPGPGEDNPADEYGDGKPKQQVTLYADWAADPLHYNGEEQYMTARLYYYKTVEGVEAEHTEENRVYLGTPDAAPGMTIVYPIYGGTYHAEDIGAYTAAISGIYGAEPYKYKLDPATMSHDWTITADTADSNAWTVHPSMADWYYGDTAAVPAGKATYGDVTFKYRTVTTDGESVTYGEWTETKPSIAGTYQMNAITEAAPDGSYGGLSLNDSTYCNFRIYPAELTVTAVDKTSVYGAGFEDLTYTSAVTRGAVTEEEKAALNIDLRVDTSSAGEITPVPVGTYPIVQKTDGYDANPNINLTVIPGAYTVANASFTAVAANVAEEYDGQKRYIDVTVKDGAGNVISKDDYASKGIEIYYSSTADLNKNNYATGYTTCPYCQDAGEYTIRYYVIMPNHTPVAGSAAVTISKKALTAVLPNASMTYGEDPADVMAALAVSAPASSLTYTGFASGDTAAIFADSSITYTTGYNKNDNAGDYAINASGLDPKNYTLTFTPGTLTVGRKPLTDDMFTLTIPDGGYTYDGSGHEPVVTGSDMSGSVQLLNAASDYEVTYSNNINASDEAEAVITAKDTGNYSGSASRKFTIAPRNITVTAQPVSTGYNQPIVPAEIEDKYDITPADGIVNDADRTALRITAVTSVKKTYPMGVYEDAVTIRYNENSNYNVSTVPAAHTVTQKTYSAVYAQGVDTVYDGEEHSGTVTVKTGRLFTNATVYYKTGSNFTGTDYAEEGTEEIPVFKNAGSYMVYYAAVCDGYETKTGSYTVNIAKAPLSIRVPDAEITYGDDPDTAIGALVNDIGALYENGAVTGLVDGEDVSVLTGTVAYATPYTRYGDAGSYRITGSGLTAHNYEISFIKGTLTVDKKEVTFTWDYDEEAPFTYDGEEKKVGISAITGLVNNDVLTAVLSGYAGSNAGSYEAEVISLKGDKASSYRFESASCAWLIGKAANEWTTAPQLIYASGTGNDQYSYIGAAKYGSVVPGTISYDETETAKTYTLQLGVAETDNYSGLSAVVTYTVPETAPEIKPTLGVGESITLTYGQALAEIENGKYASGYTTDYVTGSPAGTYSIVKNASEGIVYEPGTITVNKKDVSLTWSGNSFTYDGKEHEVTAYVDPASIVNGDGIYVTGYENTPADKKVNKAVNADTYTATAVTIEGTGIENYNINEASKTHAWTIEKAPATGGEDPTQPSTPGSNYFTAGLEMSGWTYGDTTAYPSAEAKYGTVEYTYYTDEACTTKTAVTENGAAEEGGRPKNADTYWVKATVEETADYGSISMKKSFTIGKRPLAIVASDITKPYKSPVAELTYVMTGTLAEGDTLGGIGITITTDAGVNSAPGEYIISVNEDDSKSGNYNISKVNGTYFITGQTEGMSVTAAGYTGVYDGAQHGITVTVTKADAAAPDPVVYYSETELTESNYGSGSTISPVLKNVGTKKVYYYVASDVYEDAKGSCDIEITRKTVTVAANANTITYGDAPSHGGFTYTGFVDGENIESLRLTQGFTFNYEQYGDAGNYTITPQTLDSPNYSFEYESGNLTVAPKPVTFRWGTTEFAYNGMEQGPKVTAVKGLVNNDEIVVGSYINDSTYKPCAVNVGNYKAKVAALAGDMAESYTFTDEAAVKDWSISEGRNYFTETPGIDDWYYGDDASVPYGSAAYGEIKFTYSTARDGTYTNNMPSNEPGTYYMKATVAAGSVNSALNYAALSTDPILYEIKKAPVTITADDISVFKTESMTVPEFTYSVTGSDSTKSAFEGSGRISLVCEQAKDEETLNQASAGTYPVSVKVNPLPYDDDRYEINTVSGNFTILTDPIIVSANDVSYEYDGSHHGIVVGVTDTEGARAEGYKVYYSSRALVSMNDIENQEGVTDVSPAIRDAGTRAVYYYVVKEENGECITKGTRSVTVTKKPLIVSANEVTITMRQEPSDNGVVYSGFVDGDDEGNLSGTLKYSYSYRRGSEPGDYSILPAGLKSNNYEFIYVPGILHVIAVAETVAVEGVTAQNAVYDGKPHTGYTGTPFADGGRITEAALEFIYKDSNNNILKGAPTQAGEYTLTIKIPEDNIYYTGSSTISFSIIPAVLKVEARDAVMQSGSGPVNKGVVYSGFIGNDKRSDILDGTLVYEYSDSHGNDVTNSANLPAGTYTIKPKGLISKNSNYTVEFTNGELIVAESLPELELTVVTGQPEDITETGATFKGSATPADKFQDMGSADSGFRYRELTAGEDEWLEIPALPDVSGNMIQRTPESEPLSPGTVYIYQAFATPVSGNSVSGNRIYGSNVSFITGGGTTGTGTITVGVTSEYDELTGVLITIESGNDVIASRSGQTNIDTPLNADPFTGLPDGFYNIVVRTLNGEFVETRMIEVTDGSSEELTFHIPQTSGKLSSVVKIETMDTPAVAVDGLKDIATPEEKHEVALGKKDVEVSLSVKKTDEESEDAQEVSDINSIMDKVMRDHEQSTEGNVPEMDLFLNIGLHKMTKMLDAFGRVTDRVDENIGSSNDEVLEIAVPYDTGRGGVFVYRRHGNITLQLNRLVQRNRPESNFEDGKYWVGDGYVFIYASGFSIYGIGYADNSQESEMPNVTVEDNSEIKPGSAVATFEDRAVGRKVIVQYMGDDGSWYDVPGDLTVSGDNTVIIDGLPGGHVVLRISYADENGEPASEWWAGTVYIKDGADDNRRKEKPYVIHYIIENNGKQRSESTIPVYVDGISLFNGGTTYGISANRKFFDKASKELFKENENLAILSYTVVGKAIYSDGTPVFKAGSSDVVEDTLFTLSVEEFKDDNAGIACRDVPVLYNDLYVYANVGAYATDRDSNGVVISTPAGVKYSGLPHRLDTDPKAAGKYANKSATYDLHITITDTKTRRNDGTAYQLVYGKDYTVSYKNNRKASVTVSSKSGDSYYKQIYSESKAAKKWPQIIIRGKGNYSRMKAVVYFDILPLSLGETYQAVGNYADAVKKDSYTLKKKGGINLKTKVVRYKRNYDRFTQKYINNNNKTVKYKLGQDVNIMLQKQTPQGWTDVGDLTKSKVRKATLKAVTAEGSYRVCVTGKGNYYGTVYDYFEVFANGRKLFSSLKLAKANAEYTEGGVSGNQLVKKFRTKVPDASGKKVRIPLDVLDITLEPLTEEARVSDDGRTALAAGTYMLYANVKDKAAFTAAYPKVAVDGPVKVKVKVKAVKLKRSMFSMDWNVSGEVYDGKDKDITLALKGLSVSDVTLGKQVLKNGKKRYVPLDDSELQEALSVDTAANKFTIKGRYELSDGRTIDNTLPGKYKLILCGKNAYASKVMVLKYKRRGAELTGDNMTVSGCTFNAGGAVPVISVNALNRQAYILDGTKNPDFKVKYRNNKGTGTATATVTVRNAETGFAKGSKATVSYTIDAKKVSKVHPYISYNTGMAGEIFIKMKDTVKAGKVPKVELYQAGPDGTKLKKIKSGFYTASFTESADKGTYDLTLKAGSVSGLDFGADGIKIENAYTEYAAKAKGFTKKKELKLSENAILIRDMGDERVYTSDDFAAYGVGTVPVKMTSKGKIKMSYAGGCYACPVIEEITVNGKVLKFSDGYYVISYKKNNLANDTKMTVTLTQKAVRDYGFGGSKTYTFKIVKQSNMKLKL